MERDRKILNAFVTGYAFVLGLFSDNPVTFFANLVAVTVLLIIVNLD